MNTIQVVLKNIQTFVRKDLKSIMKNWRNIAGIMIVPDLALVKRNRTALT